MPLLKPYFCVKTIRLWRCFACSFLLLASFVPAAQEIPEITLDLSGPAKSLNLPLLSGVDEFQVLSTTDLSSPLVPDSSGEISSYLWKTTNSLPLQFFSLRITPVDTNKLVASTLLNRIGYGQSPEDLERLAQIGPQAYIDEQLSPATIQENIPIDEFRPPSPDWQQVVLTGTASSSTLYIYLETPGDAYLDDIRLVSGRSAGVGINTLRNGDFEQLPLTNSWTVSTNLSLSSITSAQARTGTNSLHLVATSAGSTRASSIYQVISPALSDGATYTLSYWWKPGTNNPTGLTVRLSGSGIDTSSETIVNRLDGGLGKLEDLRAWHIVHAVQSKKQLLEVMLQFLENHFVTQHRKSREYLDRYYNDGSIMDALAARMEFVEIQRWRQALLNPECTFHDLLRISAESPAMIIYLDTVDSRGNSSNIANENYARELLELFTFGVDNGYDQNDITVTSRAWTGWGVRLVDRTNEFNPFAPQSTTRIPGASPTSTAPRDLVGVWAFAYKSDRHNNTAKVIFPTKTVPARFGAPYAGRNYQLSLPIRSGTPNGGANGMQDGYQVLTHLADQPFTQEYLSVKLCRLFIHDDFAHGYDFTDPNLSPEGQLVRECMRVWEESTPKGQVWRVVETILNSELFRTQAASRQKVKTPFEFTVSALRALRARATDGTYTADTAGYGLYNPMNRMGRMRLFDRDDPDGYPESGAPWISAGTLAERLRYVQAIVIPVGQSGRTDITSSEFANPVKLLKTKLPSTSWNDAGAVVDYFLGILYPGEGKANLADYRAHAVQFLNTSESGTASSPFANLLNTSTTYDTRVRAMVAMLMTLPRFQEQ